jgi:hypothetical protein
MLNLFRELVPILPPQVQNYVTSMAIEMHDILGNNTMSSERRYILRSLWMHL